MVGVNRFSYKSKDRVRNEKVYVVDTAFVTEREDNFSLENLGWKLENIYKMTVNLCLAFYMLLCQLFSDALSCNMQIVNKIGLKF